MYVDHVTMRVDYVTMCVDHVTMYHDLQSEEVVIVPLIV